ncbi:MAG: MBL fold metallo-hydrolase [Chloroflexota bacterium]
MQVISGLHQVTVRSTNIFLIVEDKITIIDAGFRGSAKRIAMAINNLGRSMEEVSLIIITHNHLDHIGGLPGLREMTSAKVAVHRADLSYSEEGLPYSGFLKLLLKIPGVSFFWPLIYAKPDDVDIQLEGGEVFSPLGGMEVIHTPGHTPGSVSLFFPQTKLLIVGDLFGGGHGDFWLTPKTVSSDVSQARESVKRLAQLDFDILCCGHGKPIIGGASAVLRDWVKRKGL